jgi:hypothetical protein
MAKVAAIVANVTTVMAEVHSILTEVPPVVSNFHPIVTDVTIITIAALGLCGNTDEESGGEKNSQFRFHDLKF